MIEAYPLTWPIGYERNRHPKRSQFQTRFTTARDGVVNELRRMGARYVVVSTDIPLRRDGLPYAQQKEPEDRGVAVYFEWKSEPYVLACDRWNRVADNMQAIRKSIEALRGLDRWGVSDMLKRSFQGFKALPGQAGGGIPAWWEILECDSASSREEVKKAYRKKIREVHPDTGKGSAEMAAQVNEAYSSAMAALQDSY